MQISMDESKLKKLFKEALEERKNISHELIAEAIEDVALVRAIQEGKKTKPVKKKKSSTYWKDSCEVRV